MQAKVSTTFGSLKVRLPHCEPGQRIGLLGGSFNPAHGAHLLISETALRRLQLDEVWWLVSPGNPLKSREGELPLRDRVRLARQVARDARIKVTDFERNLPTTFTAATLTFLVRRRPQTDFVWLMGADNLAGFHRWRQWRAIFGLMPIAVIDRPGWHFKGLASPAGLAFARERRPESQAAALAGSRPPAWTFLTGPLSKVSSTDIRRGRPHGSPRA